MKGYCKLKKKDPVGRYGADWRMGRSAVLRRETPKCKGKAGLEDIRPVSLGFAAQNGTKPDCRSHLCTLMGSVVVER